MGLDVYFRRDIRNVLLAVAHAKEQTVIVDARLQAPEKQTFTRTEALELYRQGTENALISVGLAFGLVPASLSVSPGAKDPLAGLLAERASNPTDAQR